MRQVSKCECGRRKSQYATHCKRCESERKAERIAHFSAILKTGVCPDCGSALRRNLSITGWWQCEQYGAETHRARPNDPQCSFQFILER